MGYSEEKLIPAKNKLLSVQVLDPCPGTSERTVNVYICQCKLFILLFCHFKKESSVTKDLHQNEDDGQLLDIVPFVLV